MHAWQHRMGRGRVSDQTYFRIKFVVVVDFQIVARLLISIFRNTVISLLLRERELSC